MNRYALVHLQAELDADRKRRHALTLSLSDIFEIDDLVMYRTNWLPSLAKRYFRTIPTNPHTKMLSIEMVSDTEGMDTPRDALVNIVRDLLSEHGRDLTRRQQEALAAYDEALCKGIDAPVGYVASKLGIEPHSASELLKRAKIRHSSEKSHSINRGLLYEPTKKEIRHKMAQLPRPCAAGYQGCRGNTQHGKVALCYPCHVKVKSNADDALMPEWLISEIKRIESEHRKAAIEACYHDHYGTVSLDELENYLNAI